ncbi:hypothetical protein JTE90_029018 [Oedothorax gibbosus]|uniref:Uncharacterized protein n=1 Tax=Oedothorax gibbosus TaxID=931172 RepID=A0AAV6TDB5_9ARAC|nr:hypothetical protein JTE90_029018 [Oedothorax gibbosus]
MPRNVPLIITSCVPKTNKIEPKVLFPLFNAPLFRRHGLLEHANLSSNLRSTERQPVKINQGKTGGLFITGKLQPLGGTPPGLELRSNYRAF